MGTRPPLSATRHLLVRLPNPLGDAVLATPALRALRRRLPDARITWAGGRAALAALDGLPDRDDLLPVAGEHASGPLAPWRAGRFWRRLRPDAVLLLAHSFSSALAARASGAPRRVGAPRHGRGLLLTDPVPLPRAGRRLQPRPMTRMYLDLVRPFGAVGDDAGPRVVVSDYDRRRAARVLARWPGPPPILAVNPGAAFAPTKRYPPDRIAAVVAGLRRRHPCRVLVLCGPGEEALARDVAVRVAPPVRVTADEVPDVGTLKALLAASRAFLGADSGPRHLAEALGVPSVVWMGPTHPGWTADRPAAVVRHEGLSCLGCHLRRCPIHHPCLEELAPEPLVRALARAFDAPVTR